MVERLQQAIVAGDLATACTHMTKAAKRHLGDQGHDPPTTCQQDFETFTAMLREGRKKGQKPVRPVITGVEIDDDRGVAWLRVRNGPRSRIPLRKEGDTWKVDALYGDIPAGDQDDKF